MTELFLQMGLSNACLSLALAIAAVMAGAVAKRPHLAHMLWLLVFVKLLTPPLVALPVIRIADQRNTAIAVENSSRSTPIFNGNQASDLSRTEGRPASGGESVASRSRLPSPGSDEYNASRMAPAPAGIHQLDVNARSADSWWAGFGPALIENGKRWLPPIWLLGSVMVGACSLVRVCRFNSLLAAHTKAAPRQLRDAAAPIAKRLKLKTIPTICTTTARLSPLVWWTGGRVRIVIPATLLEQMHARQWQWVLAHELAHVRRRDYLVRWLEWLACVCFWWNPVVWWAQRHLRAAEEICCDALVLSSLKPKPRTYATSLLTAVEFLAHPALRPPAMASEINSGGVLERRFRMIVSENPHRTNSPWLRVCILLCAVAVLPFGLASAHDYDAVAERLGEAVEQGELTRAQAGAMLAALKKEMAHESGKKDELNAHFEKVWAKLQAAVAAGELSAEDAKAKMAAIKKAKLGGSKNNADHEAIGKRLKAAVKAGKLTEDEAWAKWKAITKTPEAKADTGIEGWLKSIGERLRGAVASGDLSEEEAWEKWLAIKEGQVAPKLKSAVASGDMSEEKAWAIWHGIEKAEAGARIRAAVKKGELSEEAARAKWDAINKKSQHKRTEQKEDPRVARYRALESRIRAAVKAGELSKEEAKNKLIATRKEMWPQKKSDDAEYAGRDSGVAIEEWLETVGARLKGAVESGKLSEAEAWSKWHDIKEAQVAPKLKAAVKEGELSEEKAWALWHAIEKAEAGARLKAAVKKGELSEADALAKWIEINKGDADGDEAEEDEKYEEGKDGLRAVGEHLRGIGDRIRETVEAGKLSEEDGWKKWNHAKVEVIKGAVTSGKISREEAGVLWQAIEKAEVGIKLKKAVADGKLSEEEARKKWEAFERKADE